ncbi:hypothetical protein P7K49_024674 [Saguinus oedipus]|uniref:Uncharacterized protein n=1 Tax=Saguinus oedipus TaxID=9490 RepID=A0ABQ9UQ87_SAGOE|nr:hypothetical protein P7K49_024674 [Saguinus oedipus]
MATCLAMMEKRGSGPMSASQPAHWGQSRLSVYATPCGNTSHSHEHPGSAQPTPAGLKSHSGEKHRPQTRRQHKGVGSSALTHRHLFHLGSSICDALKVNFEHISLDIQGLLSATYTAGNSSAGHQVPVSIVHHSNGFPTTCADLSFHQRHINI